MPSTCSAKCHNDLTDIHKDSDQSETCRKCGVNRQAGPQGMVAHKVTGDEECCPACALAAIHPAQKETKSNIKIIALRFNYALKSYHLINTILWKKGFKEFNRILTFKIETMLM